MQILRIYRNESKAYKTGNYTFEREFFNVHMRQLKHKYRSRYKDWHL